MPPTGSSLALSLAALVAFSAIAACSPGAPPTESASAAAPAEVLRKLPDMTLTDQAGVAHRLHDAGNAKAVVLVMQGVGCPIVRKMTPGLRDVAAAYQVRDVTFFMVNSNIQDTPEKISAEIAEFGLTLPVLKDADQALGKALAAERTAEVFVVDPKSWTIVYHGPMDDRLTYGAEKAEADNHYLKDVLDAVLAGKDVPIIKQPADGCLINFI